MSFFGPFYGGDHVAALDPDYRWALADLNAAYKAARFSINTIGSALALTHFAPRLGRGERSLFAVRSAKVGSIGDNRLGGWVCYRASKAALNVVVKTATIELARTHPQCVRQCSTT